MESGGQEFLNRGIRVIRGKILAKMSEFDRQQCKEHKEKTMKTNHGLPSAASLNRWN